MHPHLNAVLRWLRLRLEVELASERARRGVEALPSEGHAAALVEAEAEVLRVRATLDAPPPIERLAAHLGLGQVEASAVLMALAPEVDLRFARVYAWLNDDARRPWPTVDLVLRLAAPDAEASWRVRARFTRSSPLGQLIRWSDDEVHLPALAHTLALHPRVVDWLLEREGVDPALAPLLQGWMVEFDEPPDPQILGWLTDVLMAPRESTPLVVLCGRPGSGRRSLAAALAARLGRPLLPLRGRGLPGELDTIRDALRRETLLFGALPAWTDLDDLLRPAHGRELEAERLWPIINGTSGPALLLVERWSGVPAHLGRPVVLARLPELDRAGRRAIWARSLPDAAPDVLDELANRYRLNAGQIRQAATTARVRAGPQAPVSPAALEEACRAQGAPRLHGLALEIAPRHTWDHLVLPEAALTQLRLIASAVRHRERIRAEWGFGRLFVGGAGVVALFSGPSGTGKTLAASVIAGSLGLPLFKIELSSVVSKYIGETEKNLERVFSEAEQRDAVLLFDEADALFGKRSQVSDARDRYANLEVAYLLQRTELYDGLVILTSNLKKNLDEAFLRRISYAVDFPEPGEMERLRLWQQMIPAEAPTEGELHLEELAKRYKLTGGEIRNAALAAAVMAAGNGRGIGMEEIVAAVGREMGKGGRLVG